MLKTALAISLLFVIGPVTLVGQTDRREAAGIIYFTNNSPDDINSFPVEVLALNKKTVVAATRLDDHHQFRFSSLKPGRYLLRLTWPNHCVLWYRLDLTKESQTRIRVLMDLDCAHFNGKIQNLPVN